MKPSINSGDGLRRRMDHDHKRPAEKERRPDAEISVFPPQENEYEVEKEEEEQEQEHEPSNKRPRLEDGGERSKVAGEDEDDEPSNGEDD